MSREHAPARPGYRLVPCVGLAHKPEAGGNVDNCTLCAPRWGVREVMTRERLADIATGKWRPDRREAMALGSALLDIVWELWPNGERSKEWTTDTLDRIARDLLDFNPENKVRP